VPTPHIHNNRTGGTRAPHGNNAMMNKDDLLSKIERWYAAHADGDWEHSFGVEISTLDNPGWAVKIDLQTTELENQQMPVLQITRGPDDWYECRVEASVFHGAGGPQNLKEILSVFFAWEASATSPSGSGPV
jgi:hypothetical protein